MYFHTADKRCNACINSLTHSLFHSLTHALTISLALPRPHSLARVPSLQFSLSL